MSIFGLRARRRAHPPTTDRAVYRVTSAALLGAAHALACATEVRVCAQRGGRPTYVERRIDQLNRQSEQHERDKLGRELKGETGERSDRGGVRAAAAAQVKQDLEHLQTSYNRIVLAMKSKQGFDRESVLGEVAEVHKCATRLKSNLALPQPKGDGEQKTRDEAAHAQVEESLLKLRKHVYDFLTNPLFEAPLALDVEQAGRASRDLDMIIQLSDGIGKSGDKLRKADKH